MSRGVLFDIKELGQYDGSGMRLTVFLKGCPLRCLWCHNPEGLRSGVQVLKREELCRHCDCCKVQCRHPECEGLGYCIHRCPNGLITQVGEILSAPALADRITSYSDFFGRSSEGKCRGGVTFSGGEPTMQPDFLLEVCDLIPNIPKALESCGYCPEDRFLAVCQRMDEIFVDLKLWDDRLHRKYTGVSNAPILANISRLSEQGRDFTLRLPLIPNITDTKENQLSIAEFAAALPHPPRVELLGYNSFAPEKYHKFGMDYPLDERLPESTACLELFEHLGLECHVLKLRSKSGANI